MVIHVDMDAFYASIEERENPELCGRPVIVGGSSGSRGVVSAANYVARTFGVHSAMPAVTAKRLCPRGVFLPVRMSFYAEVSKQIRAIFERFTPAIEPLALDEAFLDVDGSTRLFGSPEEIGRRIKQAIWDELQLVASVGVAPNKFLAKLASDLDKPDGFVVVDGERLEEFLDPLPIRRLWGVGKRGAVRFERLGVRTVGELRAIDLGVLTDHFGKMGQHLWRLARGIDERDVVTDRDAKSISHEQTFAVDISDRDHLIGVLLDLTEQVGYRLRSSGLRGRTVQLKIRYADFETFTRSHSLPVATDVTEEIWQAAKFLLTERLPNRPLEIRLLGVGVSQLDRSGNVQKSLFDEEEQGRRRKLDEVTDRIHEKFGRRSVGRGASLRKPEEGV